MRNSAESGNTNRRKLRRSAENSGDAAMATYACDGVRRLAGRFVRRR